MQAKAKKLDVIASCIVLDHQGRLLLLQRHSANPGGGLWAVPGGRIDDGETALEAARRELQEETSIEALELELLGQHQAQLPHSQVDMTSFKLQLPYAPDIRINPLEHDDYQWVSLEQVVSLPSLLWGTPTVLYDFALLATKPAPDPTLADGSTILLVPAG
jgi:mutator protein MutT